MSTRIVLLGRLGVERMGRPVGAKPLAGGRAEVVFAYLAAEHRRSVSREELADELWPGRLPDTWNAALRGVLTEIRRFLENSGLDPAETLVSEGGKLRLALPRDAVVDLDEVRAGVARARDRLGAGDPVGAAAAAGPAADQAALPFLSHHEGRWADEIRGELAELHVRALEMQTRGLARAGDVRAAAAAADRLVRADPFSDAAHRLRIETLGEAGDRAGALKAYEHSKALLQAELGLAPSPQVVEALKRVLGAGAPEAAAESPATGLAAYSVLVVEDHDFQRRTILTLLRGLGVGTLREAADGASALELLEAAEAPDIIICDIDMPGMDGVEFIRHVADRRLASAVAIVSGLEGRLLDTVRAASEGYGLQVLGAIPKPLTVAALEKLLAAYRPSPPPPAGAADDLAKAVAGALDAGTLAADFEPIVDLATGAMSALRVVARWPVEPDGDPLAAVDEAGLGHRLTAHLLQGARDDAGDLNLDLWLRLPPSLLADVSLADSLAAIASERIVLIAGGDAVARGDNPALLDVVARLRVKGYGLCVEGFEAGRKAIERLPLTHAELPPHLVASAAATGDSDQVARLADAVAAARALGIPVAGRCSTAAEYEQLLQVGCSFTHGPFLAPPMPAADLSKRIRDWKMPPAVSGGAR